MFITRKRHEREKQELQAGNRLSDAILKCPGQGMFLLDAKDKVLPPVSRSVAVLFRRQEFTNLTFEKLLAPIVTAKTLTAVRNHIAALLGGLPQNAAADSNPLKVIDVRLTNADGSIEAAYYAFEFDAIETQGQKAWLVRVSDVTAQTQNMRELDELRTQAQTQGEILRGVLRMGGARFGTFMQKTDASMKNINAVLKKPAREADAFRSKLEETLEEVDRIRREAAAFKITALENSARRFEDALHELRSRSDLSGGDFLPLAVKLDELYGQFALVKSLATAAGPAREPDAAAQNSRVTESGTQIIEAPKFMAQVSGGQGAAGAHRTSPAGSLDSALQAMTEHVALEQNKTVVLQSQGLQLVPARYQAAVKNVAVQFIRNAVVHGIEPAAVRQAAGKASHGTLRLEFRLHEDTCELLFEDDGCGLDPDQVRAIAVQRNVLTGEAAAQLRDREAIKLIFKSGFTTLAISATDRTHGAGLSLVRRYIHEAGGKIALASLPGHEIRFKITLPLESDAESASDAPADDATDTKVA